MTLPLAHVGHYLWILYLLPVVVVFAGILRTVWMERRRGDPPRGVDDSDAGER